MNYSSENIGKRIKKERLRINWSQEALGTELKQKSGAKQISKYESGTLPPLEVLLKLCDIFDCELGYLLCEEDYSSGTKVETYIEKKYGINKETLDAIHHITGTEHSCISWGYRSKEYIHVLNNLLQDEYFSELIQALNTLDLKFNERSDVWKKFEKKYGKEIANKTDEYFHSPIDYLHDENAEKLEDIYYKALLDYDSAIDEYIDYEYPIKVLRYEAKEAFERLLDNLYPLHR